MGCQSDPANAKAGGVSGIVRSASRGQGIGVSIAAK